MKHASFNFEGMKTKRFCRQHMKKGMVQLKKNKWSMSCHHSGCDKNAYFKFREQKGGPYSCRAHKKRGMTFVSGACEQVGCETKPSFNFPGQKRSRFCSKHKLEGMQCMATQYRKKTTCIAQNCARFPMWKFQDQAGPAQFCSEHKLEGMVSIRKKEICVVVDEKGRRCDKTKAFNFEGLHPRVCYLHKSEGMIKIRDSKRCRHVDCGKYPSHNYPGNKTRVFCASHKLVGMIDISRSKRMCEHCLTKYAAYNYEGHTKPRFCREHRLEGMISAVSHKCKVEGCFLSPNYAHKSQKSKTGKFCASHRQPGMVDIRRYHERRNKEKQETAV